MDPFMALRRKPRGTESETCLASTESVPVTPVPWKRSTSPSQSPFRPNLRPRCSAMRSAAARAAARPMPWVRRISMSAMALLLFVHDRIGQPRGDAGHGAEDEDRGEHEAHEGHHAPHDVAKRDVRRDFAVHDDVYPHRRMVQAHLLPDPHEQPDPTDAAPPPTPPRPPPAPLAQL